MDEILSDKDKVIETNFKSNRLSSVSHLLVGIGVFILSISVFSLVGALAFGISIDDIQNGVNILDKFTDRPLALKLFVFISSSLPLLVTVGVVALLLKTRAFEYFKLASPKWNNYFLLSLGVVFFSLPLLGPLIELNKLIDLSQWPALNEWLKNQDASNNKTYEAMIGERNVTSFLFSALFMAFLPALAEELFFRGFLLNVCGGIFKNMHVAIIVTSIIFSVIHLQVLKFIPMFFLALTFGYAVYWTNSIWTSILAHFLNNLLAVGQLYFITDGDYTKAINETPQLPIAATIAIAIAVLGIAYYNQTKSNTKAKNFYV